MEKGRDEGDPAPYELWGEDGSVNANQHNQNRIAKDWIIKFKIGYNISKLISPILHIQLYRCETPARVGI